MIYFSLICRWSFKYKSFPGIYEWFNKHKWWIKKQKNTKKMIIICWLLIWCELRRWNIFQFIQYIAVIQPVYIAVVVGVVSNGVSHGLYVVVAIDKLPQLPTGEPARKVYERVDNVKKRPQTDLVNLMVSEIEIHNKSHKKWSHGVILFLLHMEQRSFKFSSTTAAA